MKIHPPVEYEIFEVISETDDAYTNYINGKEAVSFNGYIANLHKHIRVIAVNPNVEMRQKLEQINKGTISFIKGKIKPASNPRYADNLWVKEINFDNLAKDVPQTTDMIDDDVPF